MTGKNCYTNENRKEKGIEDDLESDKIREKWSFMKSIERDTTNVQDAK